MPCDEFVKNFEHADDLVPDTVVKLAFDAGMSPVKAWRTHLELTQAEVARRMGITQSAYAQLEASAKPRKSSRQKMAAALGVSPEQLHF
jgi:predicted transcriptional regulator